jgi:hypothetical protein
MPYLKREPAVIAIYSVNVANMPQSGTLLDKSMRASLRR